MLADCKRLQITSIILVFTLLFSIPSLPAFARGSDGVKRQVNPQTGKVSFVGATWYVATTGHDSNSCSSTDSPCKTIHGAMNKAANGDTIKVTAGAYTRFGAEVVLINKDIVLSGGWDSSFTTQPGMTTIDGQASRRGITVNLDTTATIERFIIRNGYWACCEEGGGGVYNLGNLTLNTSQITGNAAYYTGGGIYNRGFLTVNNSTISNNTGGGVANSMYNVGSGILTLNSSTISGNNGGGLINSQTATLNNSTVSGNSTLGAGGGILNGGQLTVNNGTITNNIVLESGEGGGIYHQRGNVSLKNTIIAHNWAWLGPDCSTDRFGPGTSINSNGYNLIGNNSFCVIVSTTGDLIGTSANPIKPRLAVLQDNGGLTFTHALIADSPAIDAGDNVNCPEADQRGIARPFGIACDIGAFEAAYTPVNIMIGLSNMGSYRVVPPGSQRQSFADKNDGPVKVSQLDSTPIMAAERVIYRVNGVNTSFSEMMGLPDSQLDTTYWLPWYNNVNLDTQLRFANATSNPATVTITIGGVAQAPIHLGAGESTRISYAGVQAGPVKIESTQPIVASERVIFKVNGVNTSFTEMMALPEKQLDITYWLPWYNNVNLDTQLRFANVTNNPATVTITIGGTTMPAINLAAGQSTSISYPNIDAGPVKIESTQPIVASERVIYKVKGVNTSFSEMMALPNNQLDTTYWLPWYNNINLDTQLRFANVSANPATVTVTIGGVAQPPINLGAGESTRISYPNIDSGPVKIESTQSIVAAERVIYKVNNIHVSFSEMMALPNGLLSTLYWFPWYNNVDLDTQLRFGVP